MRRLTLLFVLAFACLCSSCGMLSSETRAVKQRVREFEAALTQGDFKKAKKYCNKEFKWIKDDKEKSSRTAFLKSIESIAGRTRIDVQIDRVVKLDKDKYSVIGLMIIRHDDSNRLQSVQFKFSMTWIKRSGKGWVLTEVNERSPRKKSSS